MRTTSLTISANWRALLPRARAAGSGRLVAPGVLPATSVPFLLILPVRFRPAPPLIFGRPKRVARSGMLWALDHAIGPGAYLYA